MRRRDLASLLLAGLPAPAQTPPPAPADDLAAARQRVQTASAELARFAVPTALEPATSFKAY